MICLDTDFIVDLLKQKPNAVSKFETISGEIASTEVNYFEVLFGVFKRQELSERELLSVQNFFDSLNIMTEGLKVEIY